VIAAIFKKYKREVLQIQNTLDTIKVYFSSMFGIYSETQADGDFTIFNT
jgi:hypothetical protein